MGPMYVETPYTNFAFNFICSHRVMPGLKKRKIEIQLKVIIKIIMNLVL